MLITQRYYLKEFLKLLFILSVGLALSFSLLDLIDKVDDFKVSNPSIIDLLLYALFNFPKYFIYLLPMALLLCSLLVFSQASRRKELIAIMASGGRLKVLFYPFIISGAVLSVFAFFVGEVIVPDFSKKAHELKNVLKKQERKLMFKEGTIWLRGTDGSPVRIELYNPETKKAKGISIFKIAWGGTAPTFEQGDSPDSTPSAVNLGQSPPFMLKERISAEEAEWVEGHKAQGKWILKNVTKYDIKYSKIVKIRELEYPYLESPEFFQEEIRKPEEMGIGELYRYTNKLKEAGFRNVKLNVDLNKKLSYPLINFFMVLLGISLSVKNIKGGGLFAAGIGLFISLIYWFGYTLLLSMGYAAIIPSYLSAWLIPILFGFVSIYMFRRMIE